MSSGVPSRASGCAWAKRRWRSSVSISEAIMGVSTPPGQIALTRTPRRA